MHLYAPEWSPQAWVKLPGTDAIPNHEGAFSMWQALAAISVLVCAAALISVVIGSARKQRNTLKRKSAMLGVSLALLVTTAMLSAACGDSATTPRPPSNLYI